MEVRRKSAWVSSFFLSNGVLHDCTCFVCSDQCIDYCGKIVWFDFFSFLKLIFDLQGDETKLIPVNLNILIEHLMTEMLRTDREQLVSDEIKRKTQHESIDNNKTNFTARMNPALSLCVRLLLNCVTYCTCVL